MMRGVASGSAGKLAGRLASPRQADAARRLREVGIPLLQDASLRDKVVLVRVDFNVPMAPSADDGQCEILDASRIDACIATLYNIAEQGGRVVLMVWSKLIVKPPILLAFGDLV